MYGKPSPQGSGNGWSGWYKKFFIRTLLELSFLKLMNDNNIKLINGEKYKFNYFHPIKKYQANYFPDYYLPEFNFFIEIKPKKLINTIINKEKFINVKNLIVLTEKDFNKLKTEEIIKMYFERDIIFTKKYEQKFMERYL
jgi:hypothetical protein